MLNKRFILVDSSNQSDRQIKKQNVLEDTNRAYKIFREFFKNPSVQEGQPFRSSALDLLWEHIPNVEDLDGKIGNTDDPGDGRLYSDEEVAKTTSVLERLYQAWLEAGDSAPYPAPRNLPEMAKICLVLAGIKQPGLLEDFIDSNIVDKHLGTLQKEQIQNILQSHHAECARPFFVEQYRAVPRDWKEGHHVEFEEDEPLPLIEEHVYKKGSSGLVIRVHDFFSQKTYALKKQLIAQEENRTAAARKHLEEETKRLKELRHIHVVQLVKSYERGGAYGLILIPAATCDLESLLKRYHKNKFNTDTKGKDRVWIRPILLTAFGCLTKGLAYIHGCEIRHKDVKPGNILYERGNPNVNKGPRFLWADFGLAYDFSASKDSRTRSSKIYSPRYAAPEVVAMSDMANNKRTYMDQRTNVLSSLDKIIENGEQKSKNNKLDREPAEDMPDSHGRKTDIFSLGCVFFEILGALVDKDLPLDVPSSQHRNEVPIFARYIPELTTWATQQLQEIEAQQLVKSEVQQQLQKLEAQQQTQKTQQEIQELQQEIQKIDSGLELAPLFKIATAMILRDPNSRPAVSEVVQRVAAAGRRNFCEECWAELRAQPKLDRTQVLRRRRLSRAATAFIVRKPTGTGGILNRVNSALSQN